MHTLDIPEKNKVVSIPEDWDECSTQDLEFIFSKAMDVVEGRLSYGDFCVRSFCRLTGLKFGFRYQVRKRLNLQKKVNESLYRLSTELSGWAFAFDKDLDKYELQYNSIRNRFRAINLKKIDVYGPTDLLADITYKEFRSALDHLDDFYSYMRASEPDLADQSLHYFLSCLYRPGDKGKRCALDTEELDYYSQFVRKMPLWQKKWIHTWFSYCVSYIQTQNFHIEGAEVSLELLFPGSSDTGQSERKKGLGWSGILIDFAKSGVFGTLEQCDNTHLFHILLYWYKTHLEHLRETAKSSKS